MRRINPDRFQVATRGTSREINSRIVLSLVREHQPISRADLARAMGVSRAAVTLIVNDLLAQRLVVEQPATKTMRGRRPLYLSINARRRSVAAVDIRATETFLQLLDLNGHRSVRWSPCDRPATRSALSPASPGASRPCLPSSTTWAAVRASA
jgi:predicted transcriptional regulator